MSTPTYSGRLAFIAVGMVALFAGLGVRLALLHLGPNVDLQERVLQIRHTERVIPAERGRIMDRRGQVLAMDLPVKDISINPQAIAATSHGPFIAAHLARILEVEPEMILARMERTHRLDEPIRRRVHHDVAEQVARLNFDGVFMRDRMTRHYVQGGLMCHVLGFVNHEDVGSAGVEQHFNQALRGITGLRVSERDGRRREVYNRRHIDIPPRPGNDIYLTLDQELQYMMESALDAGLEQYGGQAAWAIMMRVSTGEILAMASRPAFDLNEFPQSTAEERRNRAISYNYEPGSTFKVAVIAAALNEGLVTPDELIDCEHGRWYYRGRPLRDYSPHGVLSVADVLQKSSNIGSAKIALKMTEAKLEEYLRAFGTGRLTGIDLPGEEAGILNPRSRWSAISVTRIAMGHEVAVTALQQLNAVNAIANEGRLMRPYVVREVLNRHGHAIHRGTPEVIGQPIRPDTARVMARLMARVTEEGGTGRRAQLAGYPIAGKTGTAQKPIPGGYSDRLNIASFVGFLPADDPEISMVVVVDEPQPQRTGGAVAAPIFRDIAEQAVLYLGIPSNDEPEVPMWARSGP